MRRSIKLPINKEREAQRESLDANVAALMQRAFTPLDTQHVATYPIDVAAPEVVAVEIQGAD